jgi:hypothetical protein
MLLPANVIEARLRLDRKLRPARVDCKALSGSRTVYLTKSGEGNFSATGQIARAQTLPAQA